MKAWRIRPDARTIKERLAARMEPCLNEERERERERIGSGRCLASQCTRYAIYNHMAVVRGRGARHWHEADNNTPMKCKRPHRRLKLKCQHTHTHNVGKEGMQRTGASSRHRPPRAPIDMTLGRRTSAQRERSHRGKPQKGRKHPLQNKSRLIRTFREVAAKP